MTGLSISVVTPSKGGQFIKHLLRSLNQQTMRPKEVVLVLKDHRRHIDKICSRYQLNYHILTQREGSLTHALNIGKEEASGDIIAFTDDDAILPKKWVHNFTRLFERVEKRVSGISSRDVYWDLRSRRTLPTPDDAVAVKAFRWFIRSWLERPLPLLKKYRLGVFLNQKLTIEHGPYIPDKTCYSLPLRGVNMAFTRNALRNIEFPEHPDLKRGLGCEQYLGLQIILKGMDTIYTPQNPVFHIFRQSLSRTENTDELRGESMLMKTIFRQCLNSNKSYPTE